MNTDYFKYILTVEKCGSIRQAAEQLHMKQQNLSKIVRDVEQYYDITIFERSHKGVEVTPDGAFFLKETRALLATLNRMESPYLYPSKQYLSKISDHINLYCSGVMGSPRLVKAMNVFKEHFPAVQVHFYTSDRQTMKRALLSDERVIGLLITGQELDKDLAPEEINALPFVQMPMIAATTANNPSAHQLAAIPMKEFLKKKIVLLSQAKLKDTAVYELMCQYGAPNIQYSIDNVSIFLDVLQQNDYWTICTEELARQHNLRAIPFQENCSAQSYLLYRREYENDVIIKSFLRLLMALSYH